MVKRKQERSYVLMIRLTDAERRALDALVQRERQKHPGRVITRSGLMRELFMTALQGQEQG